MRNKLKVVLSVFLLLAGGVFNSLTAQLTKDENLSRFDDRPLHFGFYLGVNTMDYRFTHFQDVFQNTVFDEATNPGLVQMAEPYYQGVRNYRVESYPLNAGFTVGGVLNLRMNHVVDFRFTPGMSLGKRELVFTENIRKYILQPDIGGKLYQSFTTQEKFMTTPSAYIDLPIGFRYKSNRFGNLRTYIYGGGAYRRDLENKQISESILHLRRNSFYAEVALGLDTYFPFFRLTSEFKFSYGLNNIIRHDADVTSTTPLPYYGYILKNLNSNIFTLIFYFE